MSRYLTAFLSKHILLRTAAVLFVLSYASMLAFPARAGVLSFDAWVDGHILGEAIAFQADLQTDVRPDDQAARIFIKTNTPGETHIGTPVVSQVDDTHYRLSYLYQVEEDWPPTFSTLEYYYEIPLGDGTTYSSEPFTYFYDDNRFAWQTRQDAPFQVYWEQGDLSFAQNVLDIARQGLDKIQGFLPVTPPEKINIYVYSKASQMQDTLHSSSQNWVAGHADPELGVIVVALPPGPEQRYLTEQRIPHELMHILLYQWVGPGYERLPTWLNEGLASLAELPPNPDHRVLLQDAVEKDTLIPMETLCHTFPRDASSALLSYAQSASFVRYLYTTYGVSALQALVQTYADGLDCERGVRVTLGKGLVQLDQQWQRDALAQNITLNALNNLLPWLVLLAAAVAAPLILAALRLRGPRQTKPVQSGNIRR